MNNQNRDWKPKKTSQQFAVNPLERRKKKIMNILKEMMTEWAGGLEVMTPPLRGGGRGFNSHPAHHGLELL